MQEYVFIGPVPRFYPRWEDLTFSANPGDVRSFGVPPSDGQWVPAPAGFVAAAADDDWYNTDTQEKAK